MSGWGVFGSDSKASPSSSSKANGMQQKSNKGPAAGRSRDPAASAMAASLGLDVSAFDMPADGQHEMMHENLIDEAKIQEALRLVQEPFEEIDDSKLSDKDLEDPELLAQLAHMEGGGDPPVAKHHHEDLMEVDADGDDSHKRSREEDIQDLHAKIRQVEAAMRQDKEAALQLKREGKMEEARKALILMKQRQKQLEDLKVLVGEEASDPAPSRPVATMSQAPASPPPSAAATTMSNSHMASPTSASRPPAAVSPKSPPANPLIKVVHQRMVEYKHAILTAKDSGDVVAAQKLFEYFKHLQQIQSDLGEGASVDPASIPPSPPDDLSQLPPLPSAEQIPMEEDYEDEDTSPTGSVAPTATDQDAALKRLKTFALLENMLIKQITNYHNRALAEKNAGRKNDAINLLRQKKQWMADLELIRLAQTSGARAPLYHIQTIEHKVEVVFEDLSQHEMELEIVRLIDVKPPSLNEKTLDLYVAVELPYPNPDKPQKFQTPVSKQSLSPEFNFKQKVRIERNTQLQRVLKNRRLQFEVFRPASWFLGSPTSVGKCELKLADLLDHAEISQQLDIMEGRKLNGGKLEARVRLRTPLNPQSKHYKVTTERLVMIDKHFSADEAPQPQQQVVAPAASATAASVPPEASPRPKSPAPAPAAPPAAAPASPTPVAKQASPASAPAPLPEEELPDYDSVDWLVSNAVMEVEMDKAQRALAAAKAAGKDIFEFEMHVRDLEMKMQLLIISIQQGNLTPEQYMELLQKKIAEEKALALQLKKRGNLEAAKSALMRMKLMEQELAGE